MPNLAPPIPEIEADGPDAFAAVAQRLDALLQGKATADAVHDAISAPPSDHPAPAPVPAHHNDLAREIDLDPIANTADQRGELTAGEPSDAATQTHTPGDLGSALMDTMDDIDAILAGAPTHDERQTPADDAAPPDPPSSTAGLEGEAPAAQDKAASESAPAPAPDLTLPDTAAQDPSANDLDAELAALLAESPIDPEVLGAAEEIAQRDAEEAERNQDALRLRAEQAALELEQAEAAGPESQVEDDITDEINNLLLAEEAQPTPHTRESDAPPPAEDPSIDQIDQMLAADADDDIDMDGAFFSADDVVTDNLSGPGESFDDDELEGDFAAAEDVQPPDATHAEVGSDAEAGSATPAWRRVLRLADTAGLHLCWALNWPARKFLTREWRSTLGYVALLQAVGATAVWLLLVVL